MRNNSIVPTPLAVSLVLLAVLCITPTVSAATIYWTGGTSDFNLAANWGGTAPTGNDCHFYTNATNLSNNLSGILSINSLTMDAAATQPVTIGSSTLTISGASGITTNAAAALLTINSNVGLGVNQSWTVNNATAGTGLTIGGIISGNYDLKKYGAGVLNLNAANTWGQAASPGAHGLELHEGTVNFGNAAAPGVGEITMWAGVTFDNTTGADMTFTNNNKFTFYQTGTYTFTGTHSLSNGTGITNLFASTTLNVVANNLTLGGTVYTSTAGAYKTLTKTGAGTLTLSGANTFGDATNGLVLSEGQVNLNNATALGAAGSLFTISGGTTAKTINNTSGDPLTLTNNSVQTWGNYEGSGITYFTFAGTDDLNLGTGAVKIGDVRLTVTAGNLTVGGVITDGSASKTIEKYGDGALTLNGANTHGNAGNGIDLMAGRLNLGNANAIGTSGAQLRILGASSFDNTSSGALTLANPALVLGKYEASGLTSITFAGTDDLDMGTGAVKIGDLALTVEAGNLTIGGVITDGSLAKTIEKYGDGALTLNGANTFGNVGNGVDLFAGRLNLGNAQALGDAGSQFRIVSGTASKSIDNTSSGALTLSNNPVLNWGGAFTFVGSKNLNLGTGAVTLAGSTQLTVSANTLTVGGDISGGYNLLKDGAGTLALGGSAAINGLIVDEGTLVLGASGSVNGDTFNGLGITAIWVTGDADYGATYQVEFDGTKSVSNHDIRSQLSAFGESEIVSLPAQVFATASPSTGDITMQWRERSESESISDLLISNVLDLSGSAVPSKYLLAMTYDPNSLVGDEAAMAAAGAIFVVYNDSTLGWVNAGTSFQDDNPFPTTIAGIDAILTASSVGYYGVDSTQHIAWVVLDHASEFAVVPEPGTLALLVAGLIGLLAYAWRKRK